MESIASISTSIILLPPTTTISVSTSRSVLIPLPSHRCSSVSSAGRRISIPRRRHFLSCNRLPAAEEEEEEDQMNRVAMKRKARKWRRRLTWTLLYNSEVEKELGLLFSKRISNQKKQSRPETKFDMLVEDIRDGVLVFEDVNEAVRYCDLLQGGGKGCEGVAEIEASSVFDLCRKTRSLAVLFRRGRTPPTSQTLERNLGSRKRSLEDLRDNK
ncbi:hypothetical protein Bca101_069708 [Brassica carinata]